MSDYMTYISTSTYEGQLDELRFETLISQLRTIIGQLPAGVQLSAFAAWFGGVRLYGWEE
jgi:ribonuclease HI